MVNVHLLETHAVIARVPYRRAVCLMTGTSVKFMSRSAATKQSHGAHGRHGFATLAMATARYIICAFLGAPPAAAEWFTDLYLGGTITQDADATVRVLGTSFTERADFGSDFTLGGRVGHYFERLPWLGWAFDASYYQLAEDLTVVPLSALLLLRWPLLPHQDVPKGRLQPYVGIGPGLFWSHATPDVMLDTQTERFSATSVDLGLDARAGFVWQFHKHTAIFWEYRFTHVNPTFTDDVSGVRTTTEAPLNTHHLQVGLSFRF